jgi:hypothetical protein
VDHHYLPQFYLRQWVTGSDGRLWRYRREPSGVVSERRVAPKGTAFESDLYAVRDAGPVFHQPQPNIIETQFFQKVDADAAGVLTKLLASPPAELDDGQRRCWAVFLNSLLERHGTKLSERDAQAPMLAEDVYRQTLARCPAEGRDRLEALLAEIDRDQLSRNMVREHMVKETKNEDVVGYFVSLHWLVVSIRPEDFLITTDAPLVINCGRQPRPIQLVTVALNPEKLFIMQPPWWGVDEELVAHLSLLHNLTLLDARPRFAYSHRKVEDRPAVKLRVALDQGLGDC